MKYIKTDYSETPMKHYIEGIKKEIPQIQEWGRKYQIEHFFEYFGEMWSVTTDWRYGEINQEIFIEDFEQY